MDNLIEQIRYDHISMSRVLNIMEQQLERLECDLDVDYDLLVEGMRYMVNYSDEIHHPKEDAIFDKLADSAPESLQEVIYEVSQQHEDLARLSNDFYDIVRNAALGEIVARDDIVSRGREYIRTLRQHINLEEGTLFRQARTLLNEADLSDIEEIYAERHDPLMTEHRTAEYDNLYRSLLQNPA